MSDSTGERTPHDRQVDALIARLELAIEQGRPLDLEEFLKPHPEHAADVRKYLPVSRTDPTDWRTIKSPEELARIKAEGGFVDLIQWRAHRSTTRRPR